MENIISIKSEMDKLDHFEVLRAELQRNESDIKRLRLTLEMDYKDITPLTFAEVEQYRNEIHDLHVRNDEIVQLLQKQSIDI